MVGRRSVPFGEACFQVQTVSFREGILKGSDVLSIEEFGAITEPKNHPIGKENQLNQTSIVGFHVNFLECTKYSIILGSKHIKMLM